MVRTFDFNLVVDRNPWDFQEGVTIEKIQSRLEALKEYYNWVHEEGGWIARNQLFLSKELLAKLEAKLQEEISYCEFYLELQERKKEPHFGEWAFHKKEEITPSWRAQGDQWIKTNGRIKARVEIDHSGKMTKISIKFENDSSTLKFMDPYYEQPKIKPSHAKKPESIDEKIMEYKCYGDKFLNEHLFPQYNEEARSFRILKQMLCIQKV